jgi:glucokinase
MADRRQRLVVAFFGGAAMQIKFPVLVGDIGGTNARFALLRDARSEARLFEPVQVARFAMLEEAVRHCLRGEARGLPATMILAVATPLVGEAFRLTNASWEITPQRIIGDFGLSELILMNDFTAQGLAILAVDAAHLVPVGAGAPLEGHPFVVIGPGTGLGISNVVKVGRKWAVIPGEGGHVDLGPRSAREHALWPHLETAEGRVSAELAVSGRGLENLYRAICAVDGAPCDLRQAAHISQAGIENTTPQAAEAVSLFLTLLARIAGDMALITLARGGVYIAGGIAAKLLPAMDADRFRASFEDKAPHQAILRSIAVRVVTHPAAALLGMMACARNLRLVSLDNASRRFRSGAADSVN